MRATNAKLARLAAMAIWSSVGGVFVLAQSTPSCPSSPSYSPDFASHSGCLVLNGQNGSGFTGSPSFAAPITVEQNVNSALQLTPDQGNWAVSAWDSTPQPVAGGFSTTFSFELGTSSLGSLGPADGIAFVVQNSNPNATDALMALGPPGCGIGYANCGGETGGITNSIAIEFNTFLNQGVDPSADNVTIQSCGANANSTDASCTLKGSVYDLTGKVSLSNTLQHVATVTYTPCPSGATEPCSFIDVVVDGIDLYPGGLPFDLGSIGLNDGNAYVGFTAGTGGGNEFQQILNWTFTPSGQSQTGGTPPGQTTTAAPVFRSAGTR